MDKKHWASLLSSSSTRSAFEEFDRYQKLIDQYKEPDYLVDLKRMLTADSALERARSMIEQSSSVSQVLRDLERSNNAYDQISQAVLGNTTVSKILDQLDVSRKWYQEEVDRFKALTDSSARMSELWESLTKPNYLKDLQPAANQIWDSTNQIALDHARSGISQTLAEQIKNSLSVYEAVNPKWEIPQSLVNSLGAFKHLQEQVGALHYPTIDPWTAKTIASILGESGIQEHLRALGIAEDGTYDEHEQHETAPVKQRWSQRPDISLLISLWLMLIQMHAASLDQAELLAAVNKNTAQVSAAADYHKAAHEQTLIIIQHQAKHIEAMSALLEKALEREARREQERFVVRERDAFIYSQPKSGASTIGRVFSKEVVRPVSENGKWIEVEYFDWVRNQYQTGWALKKYFVRVPAAYAHR